MPKDGFGFSLIPGAAVQCTQTVPLCCVCVMINSSHKSPTEQVYNGTEPWCGNYRCHWIWHVTFFGVLNIVAKNVGFKRTM